MSQFNAARVALACLALALPYLSSCNRDGDAQGSGAKVLVGSNREVGLQVLNAPDPERPFYYSFGTVTHGKTFTHTFELKNIESKPITILRTVPACSCARVKSILAWEGTRRDQGTVAGDMNRKDNILTVQPGQIFSIQMHVDAAKAAPNAGKLAIVRVSTDSLVQPYLTFELNFLPEKLFELANPSVRLGDVPVGGGVSNTVQIFSRAALNQARLLDVFSTTEGLEAEVELISGFESNWNVHVTAVENLKHGPFRGMVVLRTTDALGQGNAGRLELPVEGRIVPAVVTYPSNLSFGRVQLGKESKLQAGVQGLAPGHKIQIDGVHLTGPSADYLSVELERIAEDTFGRSVRIDVHVTCKADAPAGEIKATLTLDLVGESDPAIIRTIHGLVE